MDSEGLVFATVPRSLYGHYGYLDYTQRLVDMIKAIKPDQEERKQTRKHGKETARSTKQA
jgi:hypothetical protein